MTRFRFSTIRRATPAECDAGAGAIFDKNPFERRFRDLHTVTQQSQAHAENFEALGQSLLGIEPTRKL